MLNWPWGDMERVHVDEFVNERGNRICLKITMNDTEIPPNVTLEITGPSSVSEWIITPMVIFFIHVSTPEILFISFPAFSRKQRG